MKIKAFLFIALIAVATANEGCRKMIEVDPPVTSYNADNV